mmetsp:Transcript_72722/g.157829  ORF Transcript_72722/g.157829 Transcript_72722/m.157829 type:complete len:265 (+) Transcript_72722:57-851(+)
MYWLAVVGGLFFFRDKIGRFLMPYLPNLNPQVTVFYGHLITLLAAIAYILPIEFLGLAAVKRPLFVVSMWSTILTAMFTIKANYNLPPMPENFSLTNWRQSLAPIQPWLQKAMMGVDFHFLFFALIFLTSNPSIWPPLILGRRSLWNVGTHCTRAHADKRVWRLFAPTWEKLKAKEKEVLHYFAMAEIVLGFYLAVSLVLPTRQILVCLLYWNYLTTRYQVPRSHELHHQAWVQLGQQAEPVLKVMPFLRKPIEMAKGYFKQRT